jgi:hypothetical protein
MTSSWPDYANVDHLLAALSQSFSVNPKEF